MSVCESSGLVESRLLLKRPRSLVVCAFLMVLLLPVDGLPASSSESAVERVELLVAPGLEGSPDSFWHRWIDTVVDSVADVVGSFPRDRVRVELVSDHSRNPIAYGRVRRADPTRIQLRVHPEATLAGLLDDWRGFHEFAHLMIPFPGNDDIWFSEGLASYYQHLLQARAGIIESDEAWRRLAAGFQRGLDDPRGAGKSLGELSPDMWHERAFRRVYWTGAAYFLRVDLRLRRESGSRYSLDQVLADFNQCCRVQGSRVDALKLIERFGELSLPAVWREEYEAMIDAPARPQIEAAFERLGIELSAAEVELSDAPDARRLRRTITGRD